ncbi:MAG TPA: RidA family protein [Blastocatellia bacterium]|nr:RidA family protein [Blastocatellia bacterium]
MKEQVRTDKAPGALGPYSQGIKANGFVFASGQVAIDPATGQVVEGGIREQTHRTLTNIAAVLEAAGSSMAQAVKVSVFLADLAEFADMNEVYAGFFPSPPPARTTVEVSRLPKDVRIEIDVVALT